MERSVRAGPWAAAAGRSPADWSRRDEKGLKASTANMKIQKPMRDRSSMPLTADGASSMSESATDGQDKSLTTRQSIEKCHKNKIYVQFKKKKKIQLHIMQNNCLVKTNRWWIGQFLKPGQDVTRVTAVNPHHASSQATLIFLAQVSNCFYVEFTSKINILNQSHGPYSRHAQTFANPHVTS